MRPRIFAAALLIAAALAVRVGAASASTPAPEPAKVEADSVAATTDRPQHPAPDSLAEEFTIVLEERPDEKFFDRVVELGDQTASMTTRLAVGVASYYASRFHGRRTASGTLYDETELTAAHLTLPFGTLLKVTNLTNLKSVIVRVTDRGPYLGNRIIDLSRKAAREIGMISRGLAKVRVEKIQE